MSTLNALFPDAKSYSHMPFLNSDTLLFCQSDTTLESTFRHTGTLWQRLARNPKLKEHFGATPPPTIFTYRPWKIYYRLGEEQPQPLATGLPPAAIECSPSYYEDKDGVHLSFIGGITNEERVVYHLYQSSASSLAELPPATIARPQETRIGFISKEYICYGERREIVIEERQGSEQHRIEFPFHEVNRVTYRADAPHLLLITGSDKDGTPHTLQYSLKDESTQEVKVDGEPVYKSTLYDSQIITAVKAADNEERHLAQDVFELVDSAVTIAKSTFTKADLQKTAQLAALPQQYSYTLDSFFLNPYETYSLAGYFDVPGVVDEFRNNGSWTLVGKGWSGKVTDDGALLPPDPLPDGFPVVQDYSTYGTTYSLVVSFSLDPDGPCPCKNKNSTGIRSCPISPTSGNSVELLSGRFVFNKSLVSIDAPSGPSWSFALDYYPHIGIDGLFGKGFNSNEQTYLNNLGVDEWGMEAIELVSGGNTRDIFAGDPFDPFYQPYSSINNPSGARLQRSGSGEMDEFTLIAADGTVTTFFGFYSTITTPGQMKSITDRDGNTRTFSWQSVEGIPQLIQQTDALGREIHYQYYGAQFGYRVREIEDFLGRKLLFQYDEDGHLLVVVTPSIEKAADGNTFPGGTAYVFEYDTQNPRPQRRDDLIRIWYPNQVQPFLDEETRTVDVDAVYREATPRYTVQYGQDPTDTNSWGKVLLETVGDPDPGGNVGGTYHYQYLTENLPTNLIDPASPITQRTIMTDRNDNKITYDFIAQGTVARQEVQNNRDKNSLQSSAVTWTKYNGINQPLQIVHPEGNSTLYEYEDGYLDDMMMEFYPARRGLLLKQTQLPGNSIGVPARSGSNGQTTLSQRFFYDPLFNQVCAAIDQRGNPIDASTYFTPQNGGTTPTNSDRSRYATINYFDYQKNTDSTIKNNTALQQQLGLTASQIQSLLNYVDNQMKATNGSGGIPAGFPRNLGDINGDGTGDGNSSGLPAAQMNGNVVKVQHPPVRQLVPNTGTGDPWKWQEQERVEVFTQNNRGQLTTHTDAEGNVTAYIRYPENDPDGNGKVTIPFLSNKQYGQIKEVHVDVNPNRVMSLIGEDGDLIDFENVIERTNTPGEYQNLVTRYEGAPNGSGGCSSCAYDPLGNPLAVTDPRGFTTVYARNEMGVEYRRTSPAPYLNQVEKYFDANGNIIREDTQDQQVAFISDDPTDAGYAKFFPSGNAVTERSRSDGPADVPLRSGEGGEIRPGWFTNLYAYDLLDNQIEEDIDATGSEPNSLITRYQYDANENLIKTTKPEGNTVEYDYDERNLRIAQRIGYVETDEYPPAIPGSVSVWVYDGNGNLIQSVGPAERGSSGNSLTVTINDAFGSGQALTQTGDYVTENEYDGFDRVIKTIDAVGNISRWDGTLSEPALDPTGRQILTTRQGPANGATPTNRSGTNNVDLAVSITRYDEGSRAYEQQQKVLLATGISSGNPTHNLPSARSVTHTGGGLEANSTTNGHTDTVTLTTGGESYILARTVYDRSGRTVAVAQDNGAIATSEYDGANRAIQQTDVLGNITKSTFDGNGNVLSTTQIQKATIAEPTIADEILRTGMRYDCMNRLVLSAMQGADGDITTNLNMCCTWPVQSTSPTTLAGYDSRGNQTISIDPNGNTSINKYDGANRLIEKVQHLREDGQGDAAPQDGQSFLPSGGSVICTQQRYDGNGNLIQIVDDRGGTTTYVYDEQDRLIQIIRHNGASHLNKYNDASNVIQAVDENGSVFTQTYDPLGRRTTVSINRASGISGTTSQSFQYDGLSRPTFYSDNYGNNNVHIYFDSIKRPVEEDQNGHYVTQSAFTSFASTTQTYPSSRQIAVDYNALYQVAQILEASTSDSIAQWNFVGQRAVEVLLGNGLIQTMLNNNRTHSMVQKDVPNPSWGTASSDRLGFDGSSRLIAKRYLAGGVNGTTHAYNDTTPVVGSITQYDLSGNKMFERELHAEIRSHLYQPFGNNGVPQGGYDSVDRLRKALRGELSSDGGYTATGGGSITTPISLPNTDTFRTYDLDGLGNWKQSDYIPVGGAATLDLRQHNKLNEITSRKVGEGPKDKFIYDNNGNLTDDGTLLFSYDALNRLIQVNRKSDSQVIGQYFYDALERRISKTISNGGLTGDIPNGSTTFLYRGWQVIEERNSSDTPIKQYVWGQYIDECIQLKTLTTTGPQSLPAGDYYPLQDLLYRTMALTDDEGNIAEAYDYDAYGNTLIFSATGAGDSWWVTDATQSNGIVA